MPDNATEIKNPTGEQIQQAFQNMENEVNGLINKIANMDHERKEHKLVLEALNKADDDRRCCRMIGGVMADRTVKEVKPAIKENLTLIENAIEKLKEQAKIKAETRKNFITKYKFTFDRGGNSN